MLFLKQLRAHGFKSFADPIVLDFNHSMVGVVGPNGSGKSNIIDAIRWTLGEQSTKSLRGSSLNDIVFSGNPTHSATDIAKVSLVFDNSQHAFKSLNDEIVEITREFNKKTRESFFYVNKSQVRLREIQELALETGLTRSSIAIISQGMVTQFAEAKPENRRDIFDEAIGIAKYKRRKGEAQNKLNQARENYNRLYDIKNEIGDHLVGLKKQAQKAQIYLDKTQNVKEYELSILSLDVYNFHSNLTEINQTLTSKTFELNQLSRELNNSQSELTQLINQSSQLDNNLSELNANFQKILNNLSQNLVQQKEFEKREQDKDVSSKKTLDDFKIKDLKRRYDNLLIEEQSKDQRLGELQSMLIAVQKQFDYLNQQWQRKRNELEILNKNFYQLSFEYEQLENNRASSFKTTYSPALKSIMANKAYLTGVIGPLLELIEVEEKYQMAISAGAGQNLLSVVVEDTKATKQATEFLKQNKVGRVTFLPLNNLTPSRISGSIRDFIIKQPGFIGFANDLAKIQSKYNLALDYALATLIVVENYDYALKISKATDLRFNIVTLTGEKFLPKGAIVGGAYRNQNLFSNLEIDNKWSNIQKQKIKDLEIAIKDQTQHLNEFQQERDAIRDDLNSLQNQIEQCHHQKDQLNQDLKFIKDEYQFLTNQQLDSQTSRINNDSPLIKITHKISQLNNERDEIQSEINRLKIIKINNLARQEELNLTNQKIQEKLLPLQKEIGALNGNKHLLNNKLNNNLEILVKKYKLTLETILSQPKPEIVDEEKIRNLIKNLNDELSHLGNVNLESLDEYPKEQERYDYYQEQTDDIIDSINQMEIIIEEIDKEMKEQFEKIISNVNSVLPKTFSKMFGGGHAQLFFDQPDNLLETGIDIKVSPPGKKITNLNLLSGGEKSLVALSVLFSLLQVHPLPLIILDEAEAPLDPSNVERFALYIKEFTKTTQFIIVTHREGTMANCDVLFGVTMQEPGVTKMVKIKLLNEHPFVEMPNENQIS